MKRWHWIGGVELAWNRWGLGLEVSVMYWTPPELSAYLHLGPVLLGIGWERWPDSYMESFPASYVGGRTHE